MTLTNPVTPSSDGAGIIHSTGPKVTTFKPGDKVCTHLLQKKPYTETATMTDIVTGLGHGMDGTLRSYGIFHETGLVRMPKGLSYVEASTLPCAALTAWNALFGLKRERSNLGKGDVVLVQGTGGVSVIAMQFALALDATVIATTSTEAKAQRLSALGAHHVINYKTDPNWGETAKRLTPERKGVDVVVDVGGLATLTESLKAVRPEGLISVTGVLSGSSDALQTSNLLGCLVNVCVARGVVLGTREQFDDMNRFVEEKKVKPVVDEKLFGFEEVKEAYKYMKEQRHFSKISITIDA